MTHGTVTVHVEGVDAPIELNPGELILLPHGTAHVMKAGHARKRFCDIYANYILVNGAVISTTFDVPQEEQAREVFARAFPDRRIELLPIGAISLGGGATHCATQQQPMLGWGAGCLFAS